MTALDWSSAERPYSLGVDRGVLYLPGSSGVVWNGLLSVNEDPDERDDGVVYLNGRKTGLAQGLEELKIGVSAYMYPEAFENYSGFVTNQTRRAFGFSYHVGALDAGEIHVIYNAKATPTAKMWKTLADDVEPAVFSWTFSATPVEFPGIKPTAHAIIDERKISKEVLTAVKASLYGTSSTAPTLPDIAGLFQIFENNAIFKVVDNGDLTATITGSDSAVQMLTATEYLLTSPTVVQIDSESYLVSTDY